MVVTVPQVEAGLVGHEGNFFTQERVKNLPLRPDGAAQRQQVALDLVDAGDRLAAGAGENRILVVLQALAVLLQDREVAVDDRVQQRVGQVIEAGLADAAALLPDAFSDDIEAISRPPLLEGQDKVPAEKEVELLSF